VTLEAQRMAELVLREPQVTSEKDVVMNERRYRVEDDVDGAASELLYKTAFTRHPYQWPTIGWMKDIEGFTPEDCAAFYRTYYAPNNAVVVVVGDVREPDIVSKIARAYAAIPKADIPPEDTEAEPAQVDPREVLLKKQAASERLLVAYKGPALGDADHATLSVLNEILFAGRAARLYRALILDRELATEVRGWVSTFRDPGLYEMTITARPGRSTSDIQGTLDAELARARADVVTEDELARAKARLELSMLQSLETIPGKAEQIGFYEATLGDPAAAFQRLEAFRRTTTGDLRRVARRYLVDGARTIVRVLPEAEAR
jgi:zinc protease